jgi:hypothetical protein
MGRLEARGGREQEGAHSLERCPCTVTPVRGVTGVKFRTMPAHRDTGSSPHDPCQGLTVTAARWQAVGSVPAQLRLPVSHRPGAASGWQLFPQTLMSHLFV